MLENPLKLDLASQKDKEDLDQLDLSECVIDIEGLLYLIQLYYFCGFTIGWAYYRGRGYNKVFTVIMKKQLLTKLLKE